MCDVIIERVHLNYCSMQYPHRLMKGIEETVVYLYLSEFLYDNIINCHVP